MSGKVFLVLPPRSSSVLYGRISYEESPEIIYFPAKKTQPKSIQLTNLQIDDAEITFAIIISKPKEAFGGFSGSNEKNVTIGLVYSKNENRLCGNELLRLALERSSSAEDAISKITELVQEHEENQGIGKSCMFAFVICDSTSAWILNIVGKFWAAEKIEDELRTIYPGLNIKNKIDKCSENLKNECKLCSLWDGINDFNFKNIFELEKTNEEDKEILQEEEFTVQTMFDILRSQKDNENSKSSHVSSINMNKISVNWFTGTSTKESVFKPFIFTAGARISPLTMIKDGDDDTGLNKLHANRKWSAVGDLLQSLENTCVAEVNKYISENAGTESQELDDLMKDCVEAEVKFYR